MNITTMIVYPDEITFAMRGAGHKGGFELSPEHVEAINEIVRQIRDKPLEARMVLHNKYSREIKPNIWVDVYDTLAAFTGDVSSRIKPAVDHAIKKLLAPGKRGVKDERQDLVEARDSLDRAIQILDEWA